MRPIVDADVRRSAAEFLHAHLNSRVSAADWAASLDVPWEVDRPDAGLVLLDGDRVVGAHLAFYSERVIAGRRERFCSLGAWCVLPEYRFHGLRLLKALLAQDGYHFTDLSPSPAVAALNRRLGFRDLDTTTALELNLPWPGRGTISSDPARIERTLTGRELELYRDHKAAPVARHLVLQRGDEWCYVMFRKDRRKRLPLFATILYVSHPRLFRAMARPLARHLLVRHGAFATLLEAHVVAHRPWPSVELPTPRPRMFRSPSLDAADIDYLYSELTCMRW
jgi:hypothetical protein